MNMKGIWERSPWMNAEVQHARVASHASIGRLPYTSGMGESCYSRYGCGVSPRTSSSSRKRYGLLSGEGPHTHDTISIKPP